MLVKTRARQPPGGCATDPADFPAERRPKCQRTETSGRPVRGARRILRAERLNRSGSLPQLGRQRARCERGPDTAAPYPFEAVDPSSPTPATSQWPSRRGGSHEISIKLGCGSGPIAPSISTVNSPEPSVLAADIRCSIRSAYGGNQIGPNPTDRAKRGRNRHLICDGRACC